MPYLRLELDAKHNVPKVARASGTPDAVIGWGLMDLWEWCWRNETDEVSALVLSGFFGPSEAIPAALVAFGFLERLDGTFRVKGAEAYLRVAAHQKSAGAARAAKAVRSPAGRFAGPPAGQKHPADPADIQPEVQPDSSRQPALTPNTHTPSTKEKEIAGEAPPATPEKKLKKPKEPSIQEKMAAWFEAERVSALGPEWSEDKHLGPARLNRELEWVVQADRVQLGEAVALFLEDPKRRIQHPPCSLLWFSQDRAIYLSRAKRGAA